MPYGDVWYHCEKLLEKTEVSRVTTRKYHLKWVASRASIYLLSAIIEPKVLLKTCTVHTYYEVIKASLVNCDYTKANSKL